MLAARPWLRLKHVHPPTLLFRADNDFEPFLRHSFVLEGHLLGGGRRSLGQIEVNRGHVYIAMWLTACCAFYADR